MIALGLGDAHRSPSSSVVGQVLTPYSTLSVDPKPNSEFEERPNKHLAEFLAKKTEIIKNCVA